MEEKELHETQPASPKPSDPDVPPAFPTKMDPLPFFRSKWLLLLIIGFLVLLVGVYSFQFLAQKNQQKQAPLITPSPTQPTPTPVMCTEENSLHPSCLKTYANADLGISFSYPNSELYEFDTQTKTSVSFGLKATNGYITMLTASTNPTTFTNYKLLTPCRNLELMDEQMIFPCLSSPVDNVKLDQVSAKSFLATYGNDNTKRIVQSVGKPTIELVMQTEGLNEEIDQILATFKFTDNDEISNTTNWRTYTSPDKTFSFKYPSDLIYTETEDYEFLFHSRETDDIFGAHVEFGHPITDKEKKFYYQNPPKVITDFEVFFTPEDKKNSTINLREFATTMDDGIESTNNLMIDNKISATEYIWGCQSSCINIVFNKDNALFNFSITNFSDEQLAILRKVIATVKFY